MRSVLLTVLLLVTLAPLAGCKDKKQPYGTEMQLVLATQRGQTWAIAPALNLSGQREVDPLLQADLVYEKLQAVRGVTVIPVNRVIEVYASLRIEQIESAEQAALVCDLLGCDALVIPTVTSYDPYDPPRFGGSLQLFRKPGTFARDVNIDPREMARMGAPGVTESLPPQPEFIQAVGMFDAANGSVREALAGYASGRHEPGGPMGNRQYLLEMDRFVGFVWHSLITDLLRQTEQAERPRT